jgi:hypothetical protein
MESLHGNLPGNGAVEACGYRVLQSPGDADRATAGGAGKNAGTVREFFVSDKRPKFTAKARSSPSLGTRQEAPGAEQPILNGKNAGTVPGLCL